MVFFNYATMQMAAKIVYYGPGLCGKTTNLHYIYAKTSPQSRGEMVSLETETDRTLFFDLLPIDVGVIGGFKTRLQLYTIPGQVFYNTTRKLVLKGVDGLVFVADSQAPMLNANVESIKNLRDNLTEIGLNLEDIPMVIQFNKRDLPNIVPVQNLRALLDPDEKYEQVESSAVSGQGVFETLKLISKLTLRMLRRRMMGDEGRPGAAAAGRRGVFQIHGEQASEARPPVLPSSSATTQPFSTASTAPRVDVEELPVAGMQRGAAAAAAMQPGTATATLESIEPEIDFGQLEAPEPPKPAGRGTSKSAKPSEPPVKHVRLRSAVDIMAELETLRKKATQTTPKGRKEAAAPAIRRASAPPLQRALNFSAGPAASERTRVVKVAVQFEDDHHNVLQKQEQIVELDEGSESKSLNLDVKIDFKPGQVN